MDAVGCARGGRRGRLRRRVRGAGIGLDRMSDLQQQARQAPLAPLHPDGRYGRDPDHRPRRGLLPRGLERQAVPRCAGRPLRGQHRLLARRRDRAGGARPDEGAALLHELVVCASARDRAGGRRRRARAGRPEPRLLLLGRLGGGRVGVEARAPALRRPQGAAAPMEGDRAQRRLPRDDDGRALHQRNPGSAGAVRAARPRRRPRPTRIATTGRRRSPRSSSRRCCSRTSSTRSKRSGRTRWRW